MQHLGAAAAELEQPTASASGRGPAPQQAAHGPAGDRRYDYMPTYFLRGLINLHLELTPLG